MRISTALCIVGVIPFLTSCASHPVTLAAVGPGPLASGSVTAGTGRLEVFSGLAEESDNQNQGSKDPVWRQHTDYTLYDAQGKLVEHVDNTVGHYARAPRLVSLPAGNYTVKARASGGQWIEIPVVVESDRTTQVHLDKRWTLPSGTSKTEIVCAPEGYPVGWRAELPGK
jgi:hypothetical protein